MFLTRRTWWAALVLASLSGGCTQEPATAPGESPAAVTPASSSPSAVTPAPALEAPAAKGDMKAETTPAEPAKAGAEGGVKGEPPTKGDQPPKAAAAEDGKLTDLEVAEIKKLPAGEQAAALKQLACPVSDEHLGSMGVPLKVSAEGKTFYICCKSCKDEVEKNGKAVVAKLAKLAK